ncbi:MAG: sulfite exporter TauE/SafE family protein, partial [Mariprofundaceae bacterium]|nr:sulfite exporter TauE/SafE family protein [Mariprofundaceae bacterium]
MSVLIWVAAPLIGLTLAMFGAGGGMTTVPILHYGLGLPMKEAIASSLWIVAGVSLVSLWQLNVWKQLNIRLLSWFAVGGVMGSGLGARIGLNISDILQSMIFGLLTCAVAWWMLKAKPVRQEREEHQCQCVRTLLVGVVLGVVTGVLGVGGGFLMVPALLWLGIASYRLAVAHSLLLMTVNASVAGVGYLGHVNIDPQPLLMVI